jgi:hypothetical protein
MRINPQLTNLSAHAQIVIDQLYIIQDELSEATYFLCHNNNQHRLREYNYKNVAMAFTFELAQYHLWRMQNPFSQSLRNIRRVEHLGHDMLFAECVKGNTKGRLIQTYPINPEYNPQDLIEGNTIHKERRTHITLDDLTRRRKGDNNG